MTPGAYAIIVVLCMVIIALFKANHDLTADRDRWFTQADRLRQPHLAARRSLRFRYVRKMVGEVWESPDGDWIGDSSAEVVRPLVVIDPEDRDRARWLIRAYLRECGGGSIIPTRAEVDNMQAALREFANPTPSEPTDPKVRVTDRRDNIWRLLADGDWVCTSGPDIGEYLEWDRLASERGPLEVSA